MLQQNRAPDTKTRGLHVRISEFSETSQATLINLQAFLLEIASAQNVLESDFGPQCVFTRDLLVRHRYQEMMDHIRHLTPSPGTPASPIFKKAVHDIRGGALPSLTMNIDLFLYYLPPQDFFHKLYHLSHDHLRILRNCIVDFASAPVPRVGGQESARVGELIEKWRGTRIGTREKSCDVFVSCEYGGDLQSHCVEFSMLERVFYNLLNNAAKNASDGHLAIDIRPTDDGQNLLFLLTNRVDMKLSNLLKSRFGSRMDGLFKEGFTTGGNGVGMGVCAEMVVNVYDLKSFEDAVKWGYFGCSLVKDYFVCWFHWPLSK
ncbi:MAG: ATP-binding protein [Verrucomicrobiae bacterium]|nr:ATP-binding protein [Verrucomicrobiae bacterium]